MTPSGQPSSPAALAASAMTCWWPRWTPSKLPMASAAPRSSAGRSLHPRMSRNRLIGTASQGPARDHDHRLAVDDGLAVHLADGGQGGVALGGVEGLDGHPCGHRVAN